VPVLTLIRIIYSIKIFIL